MRQKNIYKKKYGFEDGASLKSTLAWLFVCSDPNRSTVCINMKDLQKDHGKVKLKTKLIYRKYFTICT